MCLAIPGKIVQITNNDPVMRTGKVSFGGIVKDINLAERYPWTYQHIVVQGKVFPDFSASIFLFSGVVEINLDAVVDSGNLLGGNGVLTDHSLFKGIGDDNKSIDIPFRESIEKPIGSLLEFPDIVALHGHGDRRDIF